MFAVSYTVGTEHLCPTLLLFGAIPWRVRKMPAPSRLERAELIYYAMDSIAKEQARRKLAYGLKPTKRKKGLELSEQLGKRPAGSPILVYQTKSREWKGPFEFIQIFEEKVVLQTDDRRTLFRSTCVRPVAKFLISRNTKAPDVGQNISEVYTAETLLEHSSNIKKATMQKVPSARTEHIFVDARRKQIRGLIEYATLKILEISQVGKDTRIFRWKFVNSLKPTDNGFRYKTQYIAQNYGDDRTASIATEVPTLLCFTKRITLTLAATTPNLSCYTRYMTYAYVQSYTELKLEVFLCILAKIHLI